VSSEHEIIDEKVVEEVEKKAADDLHHDEKLPPPAPMGGPIAGWLRSSSMAPIVEHPFVTTMERFTENLSGRLRVGPSTLGILTLVLFGILLSLIIRVDTLHVSLAPEVIKPGGRFVTNSWVHMIFVDILLVALIYGVTKFKTDGSLPFVPTGFQNFIEMVFDYLYDLCESVAGANARKFAPYCMTLFFFIVISNWSGLIPGVGTIGVYHEGGHAADAAHGEDAVHDEVAPGVDGEHNEIIVPADSDDYGDEEHGEESDDSHGSLIAPDSMAARTYDNQLAMSDGKIVFSSPNSVDLAASAAEEGEKTLIPLLRPPTASLNFTFAIAILTMIIVQYYGFSKLGLGYLRKFFTFSGESFGMKCINCFVGILELISEISRILSFAFRLFGNIFAGEVMLATMAFLVTFMLPIPFYFLELFVGFVQALVFMMLALIFFTLAEQSHGDEHH